MASHLTASSGGCGLHRPRCPDAPMPVLMLPPLPPLVTTVPPGPPPTMASGSIMARSREAPSVCPAVVQTRGAQVPVWSWLHVGGRWPARSAPDAMVVPGQSRVRWVVIVVVPPLRTKLAPIALVTLSQAPPSVAPLLSPALWVVGVEIFPPAVRPEDVGCLHPLLPIFQLKCHCFPFL